MQASLSVSGDNVALLAVSADYSACMGLGINCLPAEAAKLLRLATRGQFRDVDQ
jgi:hypothetical protein